MPNSVSALQSMTQTVTFLLHKIRRLPYALSAVLLVACSSGDGTSYSLDPVTRTTHTWFPVTSGASHGSLDCESCHGQADTFKVFTCTGCHLQPDTDPIHTSVSGYVYEDLSCYTCHSDGTSLNGVEHESKFEISSGTAHAGVQCSQCHTNSTDRSVVDCVTCHQATATAAQHTRVWSNATYGYSHSSPKCLKCHSQPSVYPVNSHGTFFVNAGPHNAANRGCLDCHNQVLDASVKPFPAADFSPFTCNGAGCHQHSKANMDDKHAGRAGYSYGDWVGCVDCHPRGQNN